MRLISLTAAVTVLASATFAQEVERDTERGAELFFQHCAACHGADAKGNGPMAPNLVLQPKDLTALSAENDGVFPTFRIVRRIDGGDPLVAHGSPMPVYGSLFDDLNGVLKTPTGQPIITSSAIADLTAHIESLQGP